MTTAQGVEMSVTVDNKSPIQDYVHPDHHSQPTYEGYVSLVSIYRDNFNLYAISFVLHSLASGPMAGMNLNMFETILLDAQTITWYLQVISWERLPTRSMGLFKNFFNTII